jgi:hypothetical protein
MAGNPLTNPNWAPELADLVDRYVGMIRDKVTGKAATAVRAVVFGIVVCCMAVGTLVLGLILGTKLLQRVVNIGGWIDADSSVWVSYMVMGGLLFNGGLICMRLRHSAPKPEPTK